MPNQKTTSIATTPVAAGETVHRIETGIYVEFDIPLHKGPPNGSGHVHWDQELVQARLYKNIDTGTLEELKGDVISVARESKDTYRIKLKTWIKHSHGYEIRILVTAPVSASAQPHDWFERFDISLKSLGKGLKMDIIHGGLAPFDDEGFQSSLQWKIRSYPSQVLAFSPKTNALDHPVIISPMLVATCHTAHLVVSVDYRAAGKGEQLRISICMALARSLQRVGKVDNGNYLNGVPVPIIEGYADRSQRGSTVPSYHKFGHAIDIDAANNWYFKLGGGKNVGLTNRAKAIDNIAGIQTSGLSDSSHSLTYDEVNAIQDAFRKGYQSLDKKALQTRLIAAGVGDLSSPMKHFYDNYFMTIPQEVHAVLSKEGWEWGGSWKSVKDIQHFEFRGDIILNTEARPVIQCAAISP